MGKIAIVTVGGRVFIGTFEGSVGGVSQLFKPMILVEMVQIDRQTQQPVGLSLDFRKPCMALDVPECIELYPETVQYLLENNSKDKMMAENYKTALDRYAADSAGIVAPTAEDLRRVR